MDRECAPGEDLPAGKWYTLPSGGRTKDLHTVLVVRDFDRRGSRPWESPYFGGGLKAVTVDYEEGPPKVVLRYKVRGP